jgi:hypothetical protein
MTLFDVSLCCFFVSICSAMPIAATVVTLFSLLAVRGKQKMP